MMIKQAFEKLLDEKIEKIEKIEKKTNIYCRNYFKIHTSSNKIFFAKEITKDSFFDNNRIMNNYYITKAFEEKGIKLSCEIEINGKILHVIGNKTYVLQPYIQGKHLSYKELTKTHLKKLAELISNIHHNNPYDKYNNFHLDITNEIYKNSKNIILCHRDIHLPNLLWDGQDFTLIDFETCGVITKQGSLVLMISKIFHNDKSMNNLKYFLSCYKKSAYEQASINFFDGMYTEICREFTGFISKHDIWGLSNNKNLSIYKSDILKRHQFLINTIEEIDKSYHIG